MEFVYVRVVAGVTAAEASERAADYLGGRGYRRGGRTDEPGWFQRGWPLAGLLAMSMARLRTRAHLTTEAVAGGVQMTVRYDVDTFGQLITETNRRYWDIEVDELCDRVEGRTELDRWAAYAEQARQDDWRFLLVSLAIAAACGAVAVGLRLLT